MQENCQPFYGVYKVHILRTVPAARLIVLSDIHGRADLLERALQGAAIAPEDTLVFAGDLLERGQDSMGVLRRVIELDKRENTFSLNGNTDASLHWAITHDDGLANDMLLRNRKTFGTGLFTQMCWELGLPCDSLEDVRRARGPVCRQFSQELDFLANRPTILETPNWTIVHGGLPTTDVASLEGTEAFDCMKCDLYSDIAPVFSKPVVVGHTPVNLYAEKEVFLHPYWNAEKNVLSIDGGCGLRADPMLNCVFLDPNMPGKYEYQGYDGAPRIIALENQPYREPQIRMGWPGHLAEILLESRLSFRVRQVCTGRETTVPKGFMEYWDEGRPSVNAISDARLEIQAGDKLSLLARTEDSVYVRKDGKSGWYDGAYQ